MSTMSQPIQPVDDIVPLSSARVIVNNTPQTSSTSLKPALRTATGLLLSPMLVLAAVFGFLVVLADFSIFRLRTLRHGRPAPKGLWEF